MDGKPCSVLPAIVVVFFWGGGGGGPGDWKGIGPLDTLGCLYRYRKRHNLENKLLLISINFTPKTTVALKMVH